MQKGGKPFYVQDRRASKLLGALCVWAFDNHGKNAICPATDGRKNRGAATVANGIVEGGASGGTEGIARNVEGMGP